MVWGFITSKGNFKIYKIDGKVDSTKYIKLLEDKFLDDIIDCGFSLKDIVF